MTGLPEKLFPAVFVGDVYGFHLEKMFVFTNEQP